MEDLVGWVLKLELSEEGFDAVSLHLRAYPTGVVDQPELLTHLGSRMSGC